MVKDVLCMSNTPRKGSAYIFAGIVNRRGSHNRINGINVSIDDNEIQKLLKRWLYPIPQVHYYERRIKNELVGVFEIMPDQYTGPYYIRENLNPADNAILAKNRFLRKDQLYYRRGTTNDWAREADKAYIVNWFQSYRNDRWQDWDEFKECCEYFNTEQHYILITSPLSHIDQSVLESFSHVSWSAVIDFDKDSAGKGLLKAIESKTIERNILRAVKSQTPAFNSWKSTYWFFAQGLQGIAQTLLQREDWRAWRLSYGSEIDKQLKHIAKFLLPNQVTFIVVWNDISLLRYLRTTLDATTVIEDSKYVFVSEKVDEVQTAIDNDFEPHFFEIPLTQLASGLSVEFPSYTIEGIDFTLPSETGIPIFVRTDRVAWLRSHLTILHLGLGTDSSSDEESDDEEFEFLRGGTISWRELELRRDADRDVTNKISRRVRGDLSERNTTRIDIFHKPGAGGTTVARRVAWDLHRDFPTVLIRSSDPRGVVERIEFIATRTRLTVLALVDSANVAERDIEELCKLLQSRNTGCVLLSASRRHALPRQSRHKFNLGMQLSSSELPRFVDKFVGSVPARRNDLRSIADNGSTQKQTAFYFGLTAYGEEYRGLRSYVSNRLAGLTREQIDLVVFLSIAHMYGQKGIPAQAFQNLLGLSSRNVVLPSVFAGRQSVLDILIYEKETREWRPIHDIVSNEILQQVLTPPNADRRVWTQQLSAWGKRFVEFCGGNKLVTSEPMMELLRRVLIYRDTDDALGRETGDARLGNFSIFIQNIPAREGRLDVLQFLAESFPNEAHFWGHLGRFQYDIMEDYVASLESAEKAIKLQPKDPLLWHMKGMSYRRQAETLMRLPDSTLQDVVLLAEQSSGCFEKSRAQNPEHEHAYISEVQLLARVLGYAVRDTEETIFQYLKRYNAIPYVREAFDKAESLLAIVQSNREGTQSSSWEQGCRATISRLYGDYQEALQIWDSLLSRDDVYHPPVRRQIVYAMIDRGKSWTKMPQNNLDRCIRLLQDNLDEQPYSDRDLRLWLQAVRYATMKPSIESLIEKVSYWKTNTSALEAAYYLYVLCALKALDGLSIERDLAERYMKESVQQSQTRRNRRISFEWLGPGQGIARLVHQSELGNWNREINFWSNTSVLERVEGIITDVKGPEQGRIQVRGLSCFFQPGARRDEPISKDSINRSVTFFLGFSYSGIRAWDVKLS